MTIRFVAPAPLGALLAMSTDGAGERSLRAPPTPSSTQRPIDGSNALQVSKAWKMFTGRVQWRPPSEDLIIWICPAAAVVALKPNWKSNTYTTPWESVRTVQPLRPKPLRLWMLFVAGVS